MTVEEVGKEIRSAFEFAMVFFSIQISTINWWWSSTLSIPSVSSSFQWTAQQVAKLGNQRHTIYILAENDLKCRGKMVSMNTKYEYL